MRRTTTGRCRIWVKTGNALIKQKISAQPPKADEASRSAPSGRQVTALDEDEEPQASDSTIFPLLDFDWQLQIDQSCLEERQREHVARMRVERIIELIAAALPELEMRAVAPATEVWAKVDLVEQTIRLRRGSRYAVVVHLPPRLIHFLVELARFKLNCFEPQLDVTDCIILRVQAL
jgi:hypothetical protein